MRRLTLLGLLFASALAPGALEGQTLTGNVQDQATGQPLASAQVYIAGLDIGGLTQANGDYLLLNVPPGTHTVTVQQLGYQTQSREVTVATGQTAVQDFLMTRQALQLDEIVVTGTAAGSRVREIGNAVSQLDASIAEVQPIENVSDLLRGRVPGVVVQQGSGAAGTASAIKIRGSSTMRLVNDGPLVYIDGVRVNNRMESGARDVSRIDDIDPSSIESIEIIKGPAAATLYGTEAANGVIQIITKDGAIGDAQWNLTTRQGAAWFRDPAGRTPTNWGVNPATGEVESLNIFADFPEETSNMFRTGHNQYYGLDVSGGTSQFRYFVAGSVVQDEGATFNSWANRYNGRLNVTAQPRSDITISANAGIGLTRLRLPSDFPYEDAVRAEPQSLVQPDGSPDPRRGFWRAPPEARYEQDQDFHFANRMTAGLTANHSPFDWFTHRLTFGLDMTDQASENHNAILSPESAQFFSARAASGSKSVDRESVLYTTFDYAASAERALSESIQSTTSMGFQVYTKSIETLSASGTGFPALGLSAISATGERSGTDAFTENNTVGVYLQQQFGFSDRLFVTAAVRADDNSAFGEDFDLVYYPKISGSWVVSEEPFWGLGFFNELRLRAAYGESGQQPDGFSALRSFTTRSSPSGNATVRPQSPGNSELGPERGVEIEAGFDASMFDGRLNLGLTYYDQTTKDAIVARDVAPSSGFTGSQFVNIGQINNRGFELGLDARVIESEAFDWDMNVNLSTNRNRVEDLGLDGFLQLGWTTRHTEGYPVGSLWAPSIIEANLDTDGNVIPSSVRCDNGQGQPIACDENAWIYQGHPDPSLEGSFSTGITLGDRLSLETLVQAKIGQTKYDLLGWWRYAALQQDFINFHPLESDPTDVAEAQLGQTGEFDLWVNESSFVRWRELSLTYQMPDSWTGFMGASRGQFSVAARNLGMVWTNWPSFPYHDPEVVDPSNTFQGNREPQEDSAIPPLTAITFSLRLSF
ncbi:MAG: TonB-dependent receptor [Gemmatimonadota bacterium]